MALPEVLASLEKKYLKLTKATPEASSVTAILKQAAACRQALDFSQKTTADYGLRLPTMGELLEATGKPAPIAKAGAGNVAINQLPVRRNGVAHSTSRSAELPKGVVVEPETGMHRIWTFYRDRAISSVSQNGRVTPNPAVTSTEPVHTPLSKTEGKARIEAVEEAISKAKASIRELSQPTHTIEVDISFEKLFQYYEQGIYQYVYRLLGDVEDARDFTQDTFVKAYRKLPETLTKDNFQPQAWLYRIATNVCIDELRHRKLLKLQPWEAFIALFHPNQVAKDNPEKEAMQEETRLEVEKVLAVLSPRYRVVLMLREIYGLGHAEIAAVMGTSKTAVKTLSLRAREAFRFNYAKIHPQLAAQAKGPKVLSRRQGRPAVIIE